MKRLSAMGSGWRQETRDLVRGTVYVTAMLGSLVIYAAV